MTSKSMKFRTISTALALMGLTNAGVVTLYNIQPPHLGQSSPPTATSPPVSNANGFDVGRTVIASAIGPAESGLTKYEIKFVQSHLIMYGADTTQTIQSEPITAFYTVEQGAGNVFRQYGAPDHKSYQQFIWDKLGMDWDCVLDDDGKKTGVCKGENLYPIITHVVSGTSQTVQQTIGTRTTQTTFTGAVWPVATFQTNGATASLSTNTLLTGLAAVFIGAFLC